MRRVPVLRRADQKVRRSVEGKRSARECSIETRIERCLPIGHQWLRYFPLFVEKRWRPLPPACHIAKPVGFGLRKKGPSGQVGRPHCSRGVDDRCHHYTPAASRKHETFTVPVIDHRHTAGFETGPLSSCHRTNHRTNLAMIVTMKHRPIIAAERVSVEIDFNAKSLSHNLFEQRIFLLCREALG